VRNTGRAGHFDVFGIECANIRKSIQAEEIAMSNFFQSLGRTVLAGFVIVGLLVFASSSLRLGDHAWWAFVMRWLHVLCGIMWIGLLYYFNFVQMPSMPKIPDEQKPAVGKVIAPAALFWFRWAAAATVVTGITVASMFGYLGKALALSAGFTAIGVGMWIALVMAFNVWFIIWPAQKKALGIVDADAETKAACARRAMTFSRMNTMLSIPMLFCMVAQQNGGF
jgi:uncharacterized membrane protein